MNASTVAVIGAGRMGCRHMEVAQSLGLELVAIADVRRDALESAKESLDLNRTSLFEDAGKMLEETRPDCVIVATTTPGHAGYTCLAAQTGVRFILCEKPMAHSIAECDRMIEVCERHGACLAINHQMRFMEQYVEPKRIVNTPEFGGLSSVMVIAGNFGLAMNGTHYFEMFRFMTDEEPFEVTAWFSSDIVANPRGPEFEDRAGAVRLLTVSGKRYYMDASADQGHGAYVVYTGPYGRLEVDELGGGMRLSTRKPEHRSLPTTRYGMPWDETVSAIAPADAVAPTRAVLEALLHGGAYPSGEIGRLAVSVLVGAYVSNEEGHRPVAVDTRLPRERTFPWA